MFEFNWKHIGYIALFLSTWSHANNEIPDFYQEPGVNHQREYSVGQDGTEYIDPFTGMMRLSYTDIVVPGNGGLDIEVVRTYHTSKLRSDIVGYKPYINGRTTTGLGWDVHFGRVYYDGPLFPNGCAPVSEFSDANPVLELPDGSRKVFFKALKTTDPYVYITKDRWIAVCIDETINNRRDGGLLVTSPDGTKYTINFLHSRRGSNTVGELTTAWHTTKIEDRNGNTISINYKPQSATQYTEINDISSSDGRQVTFTYTNSGLNNSLLTRVQSNNQSWNYAYSAVPNVAGGYFFLDNVQGPEGIKWTYTYNLTGTGLYSVKDITGPYGSKTAYSYTQKTANELVVGSVVTTAVQSKVVTGSDIPTSSWVYSYLNPDSNDYRDLTTVTAPSSVHKYFHCGEKAILLATECGSNLGKLVLKEIYNNSNQLMQRETYTWTPVLISNQKEKYPTRSYYNLNVTSDNLVEKYVLRDGRAHTTSYSNYDNYGNPGTIIEQTGGAVRTTQRTYELNLAKWIIHNVKTEFLLDDSVNSGRGVENTYDANGNLSNQKKYGVETRYTYYADGNLRTVTDPNLKTTTYSSYKRGIAENELQPEGVLIRRNVNNTGTLSSETDGNGNPTLYSYDGLNRIKNINTARLDDSNILLSYSWISRTKTLTRGAFVERQYYDKAGRLIKKDSGGIQTNYDYDTSGRIVFESYPGSSFGISQTYDALDRVKTQVNTADNTSSSYIYTLGPGSKTSTQITNERGKLTTLHYITYGSPGNKFLTDIIHPASSSTVGLSTSIGRTKRGDIATVTQGGTTRSYTYDSRYYLSQVTDLANGNRYFSYDTAGNKISSRVGTSNVTYYTYDGLNRLKVIDYPGATPDVTYIYDNNNNIKSLTKGAGADQVLRAYDYDPNNNLIRSELSVDMKVFAIDYAYNDIDAPLSYTSPSNLIVDYAPNNLGWPTKAGSYASNATYHANGQLASFLYGNGQSLTLTQTSRQQVDGLAVDALLSLNYDYDDTGNVTRITDNLNSLFTRNLGYDDLDRLKSATGNWGGSSYQYNNKSNITAKNDGDNFLNYNYTTTGKLLSVTNFGNSLYSYTYDAYGNVTNNAANSYSYTDESNLVSVNNGAMSYVYDGNNQRVKSIENDNILYYLYDKNGKLVYESGQYGISHKDYIYLGGYLVAQKYECANGDRDSDLIEDCDEIRLGLSPENPYDAGYDKDYDGLINLIEYQIGTSLSDPDSDDDTLSDNFEYLNSLDPLHADSDCDGIADGYEVGNNLEALINDALLDKDGDGYNNLREYRAGSNADDPLDIPNQGTIYGFYPVTSALSPLAMGNVYGANLDFSTTPAIGPDGTVYFASDRLYAFYADGEPVKWAAFINKETTINGDEYVAYIDGNGAAVLTCSSTPELNFEIPSSIQAGSVTPTNSNQYYSPVVDSVGTVYMGASDGNLYAIYPNGSLKWVKVGNGPVSSPALSVDGILYYGLGLELYAIDAADGSVKWVTTIESELADTPPSFFDPGINYTPSIGLDGTIYVLGKSGDLHAITKHGVQLSSINRNWPVALLAPYDELVAEFNKIETPIVNKSGSLRVRAWDGTYDVSLYHIHPNGEIKFNLYIGSWEGPTMSYPILTSDGYLFTTTRGYKVINDSTGDIDWDEEIDYTQFYAYGDNNAALIDFKGNIYSGGYGPEIEVLERDVLVPEYPYYQVIESEYSTRLSDEDKAWSGTPPVISAKGSMYVAGKKGLYVMNGTPEGAQHSAWPMYGKDARHTFDIRTDYDKIAGVTIETPRNNQYYDLGSTVTLRATAVDSDTTDISANIIWESSTDGYLGEGPEIQYSQLTDDYHEITAYVYDSQNTFLNASTYISVCANDDLDLDQIPDCFEFRFGLDPTDPADALADLDGDGVSNLDEYNLGTDVNNADSDYDNIPDGYEIAQGFNPLANDAYTDLNLDGVGNLQEYITFALLPNTLPEINIFEPADGSIHGEAAIISLSATATDAEDGDLSSVITWSSTIDGALGTGATVNVSLSAGVHTITASVTDNGTVTQPALTSTAEVSIEINQVIAVPGDINADGILDIGDVVLAQRYLLGLIQLSPAQITVADVHPAGGDGLLTVSDVLLMQQQLLQTGTQP